MFILANGNLEPKNNFELNNTGGNVFWVHIVNGNFGAKNNASFADVAVLVYNGNINLENNLIAYAKGRGLGAILVCVNVDPHNAHEGIAMVPGDLDLPREFTVRDLVTGAVHRWGVGANYVRLDPATTPAHVFSVEP